MQSIPLPNDVSDKIWLQLNIGLLVSEIFMFESVNTRTDEQTPIGETGASWSENCIFPMSDFNVNLLLLV